MYSCMHVLIMCIHVYLYVYVHVHCIPMCRHTGVYLSVQRQYTYMFTLQPAYIHVVYRCIHAHEHDGMNTYVYILLDK